MTHTARLHSLATAQFAGSLQKVLRSWAPLRAPQQATVTVGSSRTLSSSSSSYGSSAVATNGSSAVTNHQGQQQQPRRVPDGPGLADFISASGTAHVAQLQQPSHHDQRPSLSKSVFIETYGCQMNVNDSEVIASVLGKQQYTNAPSAAEAGVVLLNTCAIRCADAANNRPCYCLG